LLKVASLVLVGRSTDGFQPSSGERESASDRLLLSEMQELCCRERERGDAADDGEASPLPDGPVERSSATATTSQVTPPALKFGAAWLPDLPRPFHLATG